MENSPGRGPGDSFDCVTYPHPRCRPNGDPYDPSPIDVSKFHALSLKEKPAEEATMPNSNIPINAISPLPPPPPAGSLPSHVKLVDRASPRPRLHLPDTIPQYSQRPLGLRIMTDNEFKDVKKGKVVLISTVDVLDDYLKKKKL